MQDPASPPPAPPREHIERRDRARNSLLRNRDLRRRRERRGHHLEPVQGYSNPAPIPRLSACSAGARNSIVQSQIARSAPYRYDRRGSAVPADRDRPPRQYVTNKVTNGEVRVERQVWPAKRPAPGYLCFELHAILGARHLLMQSAHQLRSSLALRVHARRVQRIRRAHVAFRHMRRLRRLPPIHRARARQQKLPRPALRLQTSARARCPRESSTAFPAAPPRPASRWPRWLHGSHMRKSPAGKSKSRTSPAWRVTAWIARRDADTLPQTSAGLRDNTVALAHSVPTPDSHVTEALHQPAPEEASPASNKDAPPAQSPPTTRRVCSRICSRSSTLIGFAAHAGHSSVAIPGITGSEIPSPPSPRRARETLDATGFEAMLPDAVTRLDIFGK